MAQHNLATALPANRQEIADSATHYQSCRSTVIVQETVRVEERSRKQSGAILAGDQLAAMEVPCQDEVVAGVAGCLPDSRVVRAQNADMPLFATRGDSSFRT